MGLSIKYLEGVTGWDFQLMIWALTQETLTLLHVNNKGAQPDQQFCYSLIGK